MKGLFFYIMALVQKIVNFTALAAAFICALLIISEVNEASQNTEKPLSIVNKIGRGLELTDEDIASINSLAKTDILKDDELPPLCFIRAFNQIVLTKKLSPANIFTIFLDNKQLSGVSKCSHYYLLLIYRTSVSDSKDKEAIREILQSMFAIGRVKDQESKSSACVFFYAYNSENSLKEQLASIIEQKKTKVTAVVQIDGAQGNTQMYAKYTMQGKKEKIGEKNIIISSNSERKGFLSRFSEAYLKCPDDSVILLLDRSQTLLSPYSLEIMIKEVESKNNRATIFKALTTQYQNIEGHPIPYSPYEYPILAFRKEQISSFQGYISIISSKPQLLDYQSELFHYAILRHKRVLSYSDQTITFQHRRSYKQQQILNDLLKVAEL